MSQQFNVNHGHPDGDIGDKHSTHMRMVLGSAKRQYTSNYEDWQG